MRPIAIHERNDGFSVRWIEYCKQHSIPYILVDCYKNDIIDTIKGCSALMWHWYHDDYRDQQVARQLIYCVERLGVSTFPNFNMCWHYDDKIAQKYLLESIGARIVPSYIFYSEEEAMHWVKAATFPKVFKIRGGAGSQNVQFVKNKKRAEYLIKKAFNKGFPLYDSFSGFKQRLWILRRDKNIKAILNVIKGIVRLVYKSGRRDLLPRQKGYVFFQDYLQNNTYDTRLIVVGNKCFGLRRYNRNNDFRASGSGLLDYNPSNIDKRTIKTAFDIAVKINSDCLAFDFLFDSHNDPLITEISYAFPTGDFTDNCLGYWDINIDWHEGRQNLQYLMVEEMVSLIRSKDMC
jgi:glutathione synthase/RimK-type ligase-like ATP-grasp enzyme